MLLYRNREKVEAVLWVWPLLFGLFFANLASILDGKLFPVVTQFTITNRQDMGDNVLLSGYLTKARSCKFIAVDATSLTQDGETHDVPLKFLDNAEDDSANRPIGTQPWGYWQIIVPKGINIVTFVAHHECTLMWTTKTKLISFIVAK